MGHFPAGYKEFLKAPEDLWIESGTYKGDSVAAALNFGFKELHSIEICPALHAQSLARFVTDERVHLYRGSSPAVLKRILQAEWGARPTVFWLDAHYQGYGRQEMDAAYGECPLMAELDAILSINWAAPLVLAIDDIRVFKEEFWRSSLLAGRFERSAWPALIQLQERLAGFQFHETPEVLYAWK